MNFCGIMRIAVECRKNGVDKEANMKNLAILLMSIVVLSLVFGGIGCSNGGQQPIPTPTPAASLGPEQVIQAYLEAYESKDAEGVAKYFTADQRDEILADAERINADIDKIVFLNLETNLVSESESEATVQANYDWEVTASGQTDSGHDREIIDLIKESNRWVVKTVTVIESTQNQDASDKFQTDNEVAQLATLAFYADLHGGWKDINGDDNPNDATSFDDNVWGRSRNDTEPGNYYPTSIALYSRHILTLSTSIFDAMNHDNYLVVGSGGHAATDTEIQAHAIWMGLLVNAAGSGTQYSGSLDRDWVSALQSDTGLYLMNILKSSMAGDSYNGGPEPGGSYCWVVGKNGTVLGAYKGPDGYWYAGFNGNYP